MTGKISYLSAGNELFRWDADGNLIYVEPDLLQQITDKLRDEQGLTVWERLDGCDRALVQLTSQVTALQQQYAQMQNDLSLLPSIQRSYMDLEKRLIALEEPKLSAGYMAHRRKQMDESLRSVLMTPFGSVAKLVEQVERMFDCKNGDYSAWHSVWNTELGKYDRYEYPVVGVITLASTSDAPEQLRQTLYTAFLKLKRTCTSERPVLYWRFAAAERIQEEVETRAEVPVRYKIRTRFAIPEADFSVIEDVIKLENGWYSVLSK